jgi:hypothetical protein
LGCSLISTKAEKAEAAGEGSLDAQRVSPVLTARLEKNIILKNAVTARAARQLETL